MPKLPVSLLLAFFLGILTFGGAFAASLSLTYIGTVATSGASYSHWWYTVANPTLKGLADPGSTVTVTIDGAANTATTDSSGAWSYTPTTLTVGDRHVVITAGGNTISFTLTIGSSVPASGSGSATPSTANTAPTVLLGLLSLFGVIVGYRLLKN